MIAAVVQIGETTWDRQTRTVRMLSLGAPSLRALARALRLSRAFLWATLGIREGCASPARPLRPLREAWKPLSRRCLMSRSAAWLDGYRDSSKGSISFALAGTKL